MARLELDIHELGGVAQEAASADLLFRLGMMYATGRDVPTDLVTAHKWFNIAAMRGHANAARYRSEIAGEMSTEQVGDALRAAREWLSVH